MKTSKGNRIGSWMRNACILLTICTLASCDNYIYFTEPQPAGKRDLRSFPKKLQGDYLEYAEDDTSRFTLEAKLAIQKYSYNLAEPLSEVLEDEELQLEGNILRIEGSELEYPVILRNDSVFSRIVIWDTLVNLDKSHIVRKMRGYYFLNEPADSLWVVYKLDFQKSGEVNVSMTDHREELDLISGICSVDTICRNDKKRYVISPTRKEFKILLERETFTDIQYQLSRETQ